MDKMHDLIKTRWPRSAIGGVAVIVGVFLAFTWWQDRENSVEEQKVLQVLKEEFTSIHAVLTQNLSEQVRTRKLLENLLLTIQNGSPNYVGSTVDPALTEMTSRDTWDRDENVLDELISAGRTRNLSNGALEAKLSSWASVIGEYWGDQKIANEMVDNTHLPYFAGKNISVGAEMRVSDDDRPSPERSVSNSPDTIRQLLEDPKFLVLAEVRYRFKEHLIVEIEIAIAAADAILAEIDKSQH